MFRRRERETRALPPGPSWPPAAQLTAWMLRPYPTLQHIRRRYGAPFSMRFPNYPHIVTFDDPEHVKEIFTGPWRELHAGQANETLRPLVGTRSLLLLDGEEHVRERKLLLPPFHGERMQSYGETMREVTAEALRRWPVGRPFAVQPETQAITLDIILRTVFGVSEGEELERVRQGIDRLVQGASNPAFLVPWLQRDLGPRSPWGRFLRAREAADALLYEQIEARRASAAERDDVLSMMMTARYEDGRAMTPRELRDELMTLLVAGHETTATSLAWVLHHLIEHPHVQARVHEELDGLPGDGVSADGAHDLPYLDAVIKETMRLSPVIASVGRVLSAPRNIGGWELPAGTMAVPSIYLVHMNPRVWPEPTRFDPERHLGQRTSPYMHFPFGGGIRRCIGMAFALYEMRVVLATVLRRHGVRAAPGVRIVPRRRSVTMAPSHDMPLVLERR